MYLEFFGFDHPPFALSPDPDFLYLSDAHKQAKSYMDYSAYKRDSLVVITGEIGSGKTTLIENMLVHSNEELIIAKIHQTQLNELEVLQAIAEAFGILDNRLKKVSLLNKLKEFMIEQNEAGKHCLIIFDEAQNLSKKALEEVRLLADIENNKSKVTNVLLVGQNQLNRLIDSPDMEQLVQRIRLRFHLGHLSQSETAEYIQTRIERAGCKNNALINDDIMNVIYEYTHGVPRLINVFCDTILTAAFAEEDQQISIQHVDLAKQELNWQKGKKEDTFEASESDIKGIIELMLDKEKIQEIKITNNLLTIGRASYNDLVLEEGRVSSKHAQILVNNDGVKLIDLGSTNGTKVNNKKIDKHDLEHGDVIYIGRKYQLIFKEVS